MIINKNTTDTTKAQKISFLISLFISSIKNLITKLKLVSHFITNYFIISYVIHYLDNIDHKSILLTCGH